MAINDFRVRVSGRRICVDIIILSDSVVENNESFFINAVDRIRIPRDQPPIFAQTVVTIVDQRKFHIFTYVCTHPGDIHLHEKIEALYLNMILHPLAVRVCAEGSIRLNGSEEFFRGGGLELCYKGQFSPVCDNEFRQITGALACRELNFVGVEDFFQVAGI